MNFGEALQALKEGKKVTRAIWGGYWELQVDVQLDHYKKEQFQKMNIPKFIVAVLKDGGVAPAQPYQSDLLAEDWQIVD
jgi:hypothetical protein